MVSAAKPNRRGPSSTPRWAERTPVNFCIIVNPCYWPIMGEVKCLIRLCEVWAGLGMWSAGGWVPTVWSRVLSGTAGGVQPNMFRGRNNYLQQSGCGCELPPQQPWLDYPEWSNTGIEAGSHLAIRDRFPGGKTYQLWYCEPLVKKQWGQTQNV